MAAANVHHTHNENAKQKSIMGLERDGSVAKSIACSSKGPEFNSQQPHGGSQPSVMRSGAFFWPADIHTDRNIVCIINK
ncbi:hypothetical protein LEMLEM_LOCUS2240 [Lemmus lemmus]